MSELEIYYKCGMTFYGKAMMGHLDECGLNIIQDKGVIMKNKELKESVTISKAFLQAAQEELKKLKVLLEAHGFKLCSTYGCYDEEVHGSGYCGLHL